MGVPAFVIDRYKPHAAFDKPAGYQAGPCKAGLLGIAAVEGERFGRLFAQVHQFWGRGLQSMRHFIAGDPRGNLGVAVGREPTLVELSDQPQGIVGQSLIGSIR